MSHAWRPLLVVLGLVGLILVAREILVPSDFKAYNGDYKYQWHRAGAVEDGKNFPVGHKGREFCKQCHLDKIEIVAESGHAKVQCENCHVLYEVEAEQKGHPVDLKADFEYPLDIGINRSRELCKRCHAELPYRPADYTAFETGPIKFKMIDPEKHNPGTNCVDCHDVHRTGFKCVRCHTKQTDKPPVFPGVEIPEYNAEMHKQVNPGNNNCTTCHDGHKSGFKFKANQNAQKPTDQPAGQSQETVPQPMPDQPAGQGQETVTQPGVDNQENSGQTGNSNSDENSNKEVEQ